MNKRKKNYNESPPKQRKPRKRNIHLFETPEFKAKLTRSINEHLEKKSQEGLTFPTNIPLNQLLSPCKKTRGKKGRITRPQNAFILYRKDFQDKIKKENPEADFMEISKIAGTWWKNETDQTRNNYILLSTLHSTVHQELFPDYYYKPKPRQKVNVEHNNDNDFKNSKSKVKEK